MTGHPRVFLIKSPPEPERPRWLSPRGPIGTPLSLIAIVVILGLIFTSANSIWRYVKSTGAMLKIEGDTLRADDFVRAARIPIETTAIVQDARNAWAKDPGGRVLAFRTSDLGYYSGLPFLSNLDTGFIPYLEIKDPHALWEALRKDDFRLILQPGYPWPEVNNTAFDALLADPRYVEVLSERDVMRLLRLRPEILQEPLIVVGHEGEGSRTPLHSSKWTAWSSPASDIEPAIVSDAPLSVKIPHRLFADRARWDYIDRGIPDGSAPPAFKTRDGVVVIDVDIEGRGRTELLAVHLGPAGNTIDTLIWSGTLLGGRRTISGQLEVPKDALADANGQHHFGLRLRVYRGSGLTRIHSWRARWMGPTDAQLKTGRQHYVPQDTAEDEASIRSLASEGARAALFIGGAAPHTEFLAVCPQGEIGLAPTRRQDDRLVFDNLPCWPLTVILKTPPDDAPRAVVAKLRIFESSKQFRTFRLVPLEDALEEIAKGR